MTLALYRIDDRLIHGQVVVGWGQPLNVTFIILVDDEVRGSDWEQDLYRMGVPPEMEGQLFEPGVSTKTGGWGMGLALARRIVEQQHGGRVAYEPGADGTGAIFVLEFPLSS